MALKKRDLFATSALPKPARLQRPTIELDKLKTDGGTQPRESLDQEVIEEYVSRMKLDEATGFVLDPEGQKWPELVIFFDGKEHWLADGFHRYSAALEAGLTSFQARIEEGTLREAVRFSLGVNATHGKRRTNADKRRAVERALVDDEWRLWTDARVAQLCKVTAGLVSRVREELERSQSIPFEPILNSADGREFEREAPPASSSAPAAPVEAPIPAKKAASKSKTAAAVASLASAQELDVLIAYPLTSEDWAMLAQHADHALKADGLLIAHLAPGDPRLWDGPQQLRALEEQGALKPARLCYIQSHDRHYAVWGRAALDHGALLKRPAPLLKGAKKVFVFGTALDQW